MNYFELYPGDYLRDTTRLTLIEHGAYLRLLMAYYAEERPLPADEAELFVIVSAVLSADKAAVRKVADRFFPVDEDGLRRNSRADEEIEKAQRRIAIARENGLKGGRKPKPAKNPAGNPSGIPPGNPAGSKSGTQRDTQRAPQSGEALHTPHASEEQNQNQGKEREKTDNLPGVPLLASKRAGAVQLDTWLDSLPGGQDAIPADDPIFRYAGKAGIPLDFLELSWLRFCEAMREGRKRKTDWRAHYRNAVKANWYKLWWLTPEGEYRLTTVGEQTRRAAA